MIWVVRLDELAEIGDIGERDRRETPLTAPVGVQGHLHEPISRTGVLDAQGE
jgi:hypothetical protein